MLPANLSQNYENRGVNLGAKMVNATFACRLFTPPVLVYMYVQMCHLPSLPHNLLLSFYIFATYLDTLRAEVSPGFNPFFRPVDQQEKQIFNLSHVLHHEGTH